MSPATNDPHHNNQPPEKAGRDATPALPAAPPTKETGGPKGPEPTRYGDWEKNGICSDF